MFPKHNKASGSNSRSAALTRGIGQQAVRLDSLVPQQTASTLCSTTSSPTIDDGVEAADLQSAGSSKTAKNTSRADGSRIPDKSPTFLDETAAASPDDSKDWTTTAAHDTGVETGERGGDHGDYSRIPPGDAETFSPQTIMPLAPYLLSDSRRHATGSYGSVSLEPSRDVSPAGSDLRARDAHALRPVGSSNLPPSPTSTRAPKPSAIAVSKKPRRQSSELDAAVLATGLEGRFGVAPAPIAAEVLVDSKTGSFVDDEDTEGEEAGTTEDDEDGDGDEDEEAGPPDDSPYEAVRASVSPVDNITLSINTPRMWTLSVLFSVLGSSTNLFFSLRYPSVGISPVIALLLAHPLGHLWDRALKRDDDPSEEFVAGDRVPAGSSSSSSSSKAARLRRWLAQGRWNEKEHTCVYVSSNVAFGFAFATDVIVEQTQFYRQPASITYQLLLTLSTQILGYAFAGLTRRFLVRPSGMVWPGTLMSAAMFATLHTEENRPAGRWRISRWRFFMLVFGGAFAFYFLPGLLMPALSYFNVVTWFAPRNVVVANLFGVVSGLGLFPVTFDWAQITYTGSPILVPFWAAMNVMGGLLVVMWIMAPLAYYANLFYSSYMPILSSSVFDNTGQVYNVTRILTPEFLFDREAYRSYSRVFLPITYVLSYGVQFAGLAALLTHTACWHGRDIWVTGRKSFKEAWEDDKQGAYEPVANSTDELLPEAAPDTPSLGRVPSSSASQTGGGGGLLGREDVHCRLMRRYQDAPMSWYLLTFVTMFAVGIFVVEYYPVHLPWYGLVLALGICAVFFIPNGIIMAVTNQHSSIYLLCQLVCGVLFPGRPIANMVFVTYGYISSAQGIKFASDLKLGHYMKIPPRILFKVQMAATAVSSLTQIVVLNWMFGNIRGLCTAEALNGFICPIARVHFNGSILWGVVGPGEFFGPGAQYRPLVWCFLVGAVLPVPLWLVARRRRRDSMLKKINLPVVFGAMGWIPPATGLNFSVWAVVCYVFNYLIKRRAPAWWAKYTMTLSAALDSGLAFGIVVVFFGFVYPGWMSGFRWWGTEIYKEGCDWQACSYRTVPPGGHFGPDKW